MQDVIKINQEDNVAVALRPIAKGETLDIAGTPVTTLEEIPQGHKVAIKPIAQGGNVIKYGFRIGIAKEDIKVGQWVHVHNIKTALGDLLTYEYEPTNPSVTETEHAYFDGFRRTDGKVGVRNEIWIVPTVGCVNSIAQALEKASKKFIGGSLEDVISFPHPYGCSQMGDDQEHTRTVLADMIHHPNAAGVLVLGLGCENSNIPVLKEYIGEYDEQRVKFLQCQDVEDEMDAAMELIEELAQYAKAFQREKIDASELVIGMKCGGSETIYENPSPGNKKGGISTLEDKSLGCTQKSGSAPVKGVLAYGEQVKTKGLNLLSAPGNDLVASTALAVSGAQIVLFTTGRGTPFASPVPTVKISSNSALAGKKNNWIDFNAGRMVEDKSKEELAKELFEYVLAVASGKKVKAEEAGFHDMAIFKQGVTL